MFKNNHLETFIKGKLYNMYKQFIERSDENATQDEILKDFKSKLTTEDFIVALVKDVRFTTLFNDWLENITWQEILKNEIDKKLNYKEFFASEVGANKPDYYEDYLSGSVPEPVRAICYAHDISDNNDKIRLELAFPLLFDEHKKLLDSLSNKKV